jgi:hypothetical protein
MLVFLMSLSQPQPEIRNRSLKRLLFLVTMTHLENCATDHGTVHAYESMLWVVLLLSFRYFLQCICGTVYGCLIRVYVLLLVSL